MDSLEWLILRGWKVYCFIASPVMAVKISLILLGRKKVYALFTFPLA